MLCEKVIEFLIGRVTALNQRFGKFPIGRRWAEEKMMLTQITARKNRSNA